MKKLIKNVVFSGGERESNTFLDDINLYDTIFSKRRSLPTPITSFIPPLGLTICFENCRNAVNHWATDFSIPTNPYQDSGMKKKSQLSSSGWWTYNRQLNYVVYIGLAIWKKCIFFQIRIYNTICWQQLRCFLLKFLLCIVIRYTNSLLVFINRRYSSGKIDQKSLLCQPMTHLYGHLSIGKNLPLIHV